MEEILNSQMINAFNQGDEKIFKTVFRHYYPALFLFVRKLTESREEAEDITLRAFQSLFDRCDKFETEINIKAFLYVTCRNSGINYINAKEQERQRLKQFSLLLSNEGESEVIYNINNELVAAVNRAIEELPDSCRKVFEMLYYEELAPAEIAGKLNITVSTVYNQKSRAIKALRLKFSEYRIGMLLIVILLSSYN
jgi:RNA polymerase sigma-70 factor (family 1)